MEMKRYERKYLDLVNGERLAYIDEGHGDTVIIGCHGNYSSCQGMYYLPQIFDGNKYRVIVPDNRGFGESTWNTKISSMEDFAHDIVMLVKGLGVKKAIVIGHSYGGGTAMELAIQAPELVEKLVLIAPTCMAGYPLYKGNEQLGFKPYESMEEMRNYPTTKPIFDMMEFKQVDVCKGFLANISPSRALQPEILDALVEETLKERCILEVCWAMATYNITNVDSPYSKGNGNYAKITCPVMLCVAGKDTMVFPQMSAINKTFLEKNGKLTYKYYPEAGHAIYESVPTFFDDVKEFLNK